ncbi:DUF397 domain-containing protein [Streptomyces microflavus]|uniref:DUF397 domain-containing protein n=1 Tax=Streptomyces microflavus TaxID=1919 RepID=UPI0029A1DA7B|nr:DUF397 domain-containing protein [Streptomyces microflavus]MDX2408370.1 DUF397 domain-containing protein [Streptomyces microflavus]
MTTASLSERQWVKSSYSNNGGSCVEWAPHTASTTGLVPVRDSKNTTGPALNLRADVFSTFVTGIKAGDFGTV